RLYCVRFFVVISGRTHTSPLFPYTTLFRSEELAALTQIGQDKIHGDQLALDLGHDDGTAAGSGQPTVVGSASRVLWQTLEDAYRSEEHTSELQSRFELVCRLLLEKKNTCRP